MNIGELVEKECRICKVNTQHRYDGFMLIDEDRNNPMFSAYLDYQNYTCQECKGTFAYNGRKRDDF